MVGQMPPSACIVPRSVRRLRDAPGTHLGCRLLAGLAFATVITAPAAAQRVRISALTDVSFGMLTSLQSDHRQSQSICVYSNGQTGAYSVSAWGSGSAGSFEMSNGLHTLHYDLEWSPISGQANGTALAPSVALTGQVSGASHQTCSTGSATSASLIVVLRGVDLMQAREGTYSGSLSLLISAE
jgi:hypothetical protein